MTRIVLTGVAGFIGHRTCKELLDQGHVVIGIDNINDYYDTKLKNFRLDELQKYKNFNFFKVDIENKKALDKLFESQKNIGTIINLAARAGVRYSMENPSVYVSTNIMGTLNLLENCKKHNIKKFVLASTSSLYAGKEMPFLENCDVSEPISPYAASKKGAESMAYTYHYLYDIDISVVRYFTVYGELSRPDMAQMRFMRWIDQGDKIQLYGDGEQSRDFTYVSDIAKGTILAATKKLGFEIINLGGGNNPISINTMLGHLGELLGKETQVENLPFNKADMKTTWANIDKAKRLLNWEPTINFKQGLELSVEHYLKNKAFYQSINLG